MPTKTSPINAGKAAIIMSAPLPFANDVTLELFDQAQNVVVGYVFVNAGVAPVAQEQRWVLHAEWKSPPQQQVVFRYPQEIMRQWKSLDEFLDALRKGTNGPLWKKGATYVKVVSQTFDTFPEKDPEPLPAPELFFEGPDPLLPPNQQIDDHPAELSRSQTTSTPTGYVLGTPIVAASAKVKQNVEYWVTSPAYAPGNEATSMCLQKDANPDHQSVSTFLAAMRRLEGARLTVASCSYAGEIPTNP